MSRPLREIWRHLAIPLSWWALFFGILFFSKFYSSFYIRLYLSYQIDFVFMFIFPPHHFGKTISIVTFLFLSIFSLPKYLLVHTSNYEYTPVYLIYPTNLHYLPFTIYPTTTFLMNHTPPLITVPK